MWVRVPHAGTKRNMSVSAGSNRRKSEYLASLDLRRSTWRKIQMGVSDEFTAGGGLLHNKRPVSDAAAQR
jgi:hypothetical protein